MQERKKRIIEFRKDYGISGATLNLNITHLYFFKAMFVELNNALNANDTDTIKHISTQMLPFLEKFKDVVHPEFDNIWEDYQDSID